MVPRTRLHLRACVTAIVVGVVACLVGCGPPASGEPATDDTRALQAQFDAVRPGGSIVLERKTYHHAGVLRLRVSDVRIDGNGATLQATNDATSAVQIIGDRVRLTNINLSAPTEGKRWTAPDQHKLVISGSGDRVDRVSINGSAGAGIFVDGAQYFDIGNVSVTGTRADGIHMTNGSRRGVVHDVRTDQTGDDAVAVVSYANEPARSGDITIRGLTVASTRWGRGISVVGGDHVNISNFSVSNTDSAGIYVAAEGSPFFTNSVDAVTIANGSIRSANRSTQVLQGAVLVFSGNSGHYIRDVRMSKLLISDTPKTAPREVSIIAQNGGTVSGVQLLGFTLVRSTVTTFYADVPASSYTVAGWTKNGAVIRVGR